MGSEAWPDAAEPRRIDVDAAGLPDLPSWWSEDGAPGWNQDVWLGASPPWSLAGHAYAGWSLGEPYRAPRSLLNPGMTGIQSPIVWYDSLAVVLGEGGAWDGFHGTLAHASGEITPPTRRGARTIVDLRSGSFGYDENSLSIERGDSTTWLRAEASAGNREAAEALGIMGRHLWGAAGGFERGRHRFAVHYVERGHATSIGTGDEQAATGESGSLDYRVRTPRIDAGLSLERGYDRHESFNVGLPDELPQSRRDAQSVAIVADATRHFGAQDLALKLEWRKAKVARSGDLEFDRRNESWWSAARIDRPLGKGHARVDLGLGHNDAINRIDAAPSFTYRLEGRSLALRLGFERVLAPVWSDLAPGEGDFLQRTWAGVVGLGAQQAARGARATFLFGRTQDRALIARLPFEELWLRVGIRRDPQQYDFGLLTLEAENRWRHLSAGARGFVLARRQSGVQPFVDPATSAHTWVEYRFRSFGSQLGVAVRAELDGVGTRESPGDVPGFGTAPLGVGFHTLASYVTTNLGAAFTFSGVIVTLRVRNLANARHGETWIDYQSSEDALSPGREWRFALTSRLKN